MSGPSEFALNVLASWLGNKLDLLFKRENTNKNVDKNECTEKGATIAKKDRRTHVEIAVTAQKNTKKISNI